MKLKRAISAPVGLASQAQDNLRFIRETMSRSVQFTAVPGWGMVGIGCSAVLAYLVARQQGATSAQLAVWVAESLLAASLGALAIFRKARREGLLLSHAVSRRFFLNLAPPMVAGGLLTAALWKAGNLQVIPGMWLLLYGTGVFTGGAFSVKPVPMMGLAFAGLGGLALLSAPLFQQEFLLAGFGGFHLIFGTYIARQYGG